MHSSNGRSTTLCGRAAGMHCVAPSPWHRHTLSCGTHHVSSFLDWTRCLPRFIESFTNPMKSNAKRGSTKNCYIFTQQTFHISTEVLEDPRACWNWRDKLFANFFSLLPLREFLFFASILRVQLAQTDRGQFHFCRAAVSAQLKRRVGLDLVKTVALRITLNLGGTPIISKSHTHPSH